MATYVKFEAFVEHLAEKVHDCDLDTFKALLSVDAPSASLDAVKADLTSELAGGNGYTAGGHDITTSTSRTGGTLSVVATDVTITATGGTVGPFRYVVVYNDTPTIPADPLVCYYDYGSSITLAAGETFTINFGSSLFTLA